MQVCGVGQVVEHDQPPLAGAGQPTQQAGGGPLPSLSAVDAQLLGGVGVTVHNGRARRCWYPHEQVDLALVPHLFGVACGQLRLAHPAEAGQNLGQHHCRSALSVGEGVLFDVALLQTVSQRRDHTHAQRPHQIRTRRSIKVVGLARVIASLHPLGTTGVDGGGWGWLHQPSLIDLLAWVGSSMRASRRPSEGRGGGWNR